MTAGKKNMITPLIGNEMVIRINQQEHTCHKESNRSRYKLNPQKWKKNVVWLMCQGQQIWLPSAEISTRKANNRTALYFFPSLVSWWCNRLIFKRASMFLKMKKKTQLQGPRLAWMHETQTTHFIIAEPNQIFKAYVVYIVAHSTFTNQMCTHKHCTYYMRPHITRYTDRKAAQVQIHEHRHNHYAQP